MKRLTIFTMTALMMFALTLPATAQLRNDRDIYTGVITNINNRNKEITVLLNSTKAEKVFKVEAGIESLSEDRKVLINAQKGTNLANKVRMLPAEDKNQVASTTSRRSKVEKAVTETPTGSGYGSYGMNDNTDSSESEKRSWSDY